MIAYSGKCLFVYKTLNRLKCPPGMLCSLEGSPGKQKLKREKVDGELKQVVLLDFTRLK